MLLDGKSIIITGVGPGMGREMALIATREGARVTIAARSADFLASVEADIHAEGGEAIAIQTDVGDAMQCERLAQGAANAFGRIDGLVNSAVSSLPTGPVEGADLEAWMSTMSVSCFGALRMYQAILPVMKHQRDGAIVNISSMAAIKPSAGQAAYAVAKAALEGATRQLAAEAGPFNIRVNCVRPGWMWGASVERHLAAEARTQGVSIESLAADLATNIPLGFMPPDADCAGAVLMLLSDYARMVTGATLDVNGGEVMSP